ncbi:helix-turn-helix domain-containing protein [Ferrimicrobium acidiphilum]|uniref:helix-turn-helix domain-containing protein n=1 Tax=Ferrimicrobium acidiphilum TaxID=121039 RepID=UPI0023F35FAB|nr:helix-turn-helix domain-containing protein [Ferrimicrobium acidiphilum]
MEISDRIKEERVQRGWTQASLAGRVPIGQQTVSRWENGKTRPHRNQVKRLLELFELDPELLETWLDQSRKSTKGELPRARPLNPDLPIGSLNAADFERFCRSLIKALRPAAEVFRFGDQGDRQDGIDLYAEEPNGIITTYQCKRYEQRTNFRPANVIAAMTANAIPASHHYILLTRTATPGARKIVLGNPDWSLWDLEDIAEVIRRDLDLNARIQLVDRFFPNHREDFLGVPERGPWLTAEEFFRAFDDPLKLLNHAWSLVGRQQDVDDLTAFSTETDTDRLALVIGPGGSGKSRLLRAVVASLEKHPELRVRFLLPGTAVTAGLVEQLPEGRSVLVIDDAHETPALDGLLYAVAALRPEIRVIAATRPYGVAHIRSVAQSANLVDKPLEIGLRELSLPEVTALATEVMQAESFSGVISELAHNVAVLTRDCPLATVIGARLVAGGQILPQAVVSDQQFRDRLVIAFRDVLTGGLCEPGERDVLDRLLEFFALLQPLAPDGPEFDALLQLMVGKSRAELRRLLTRLEDAGVLIRRGGLLRLVPDVLADIIAERACIDERTGQPTSYVDKLFDLLAGMELQNLLVNVGKLEWRLSNTTTATPGARLLDRVWAQVDNHLRKAGLGAERRAILETIANVAYFQPERALELAAKTIHDAGLDKEPEGQELDPEVISLISALVPILRHVAYTYQYLGPAVDLLWTVAKSYRPAAGGSSNAEPLRALQQIAGFGPGKPMAFHEVVIERALDWVASPSTPSGPSLFDVFDVFLATEGTEDSFDERQITMRGFLITADVVRPLRERVIEAAFSVLEHGPLHDAVRALKTLEHSLRIPVGLAGAHPSNEQRTQWDPDHLSVLNHLSDLVSSTALEPLLYVEIRHVVRWHAVHGHDETQKAARQVLASLPTDLNSRVTRCLIEGFAWASDDPSDDYEAAEQHHQRYQTETADQLLHDMPDIGECVAYLTERLKIINSVTTGRAVIPGPFLASLIERDPNIARRVIEAVLAEPATRLGEVLSVALSQLALTAPAEAVESSKQLLALGSIEVDRSVARSFSLELGGRTELHAVEIALIESLAKHPDAGVRVMMVCAADQLAATSKARAVRFLLRIDFQDSTSVAAAVLGKFNRHGFSVNDLNLAERSEVLKRLEVCPSLNDYAIGLFLGAIARDDAEEVVAMLRARIDRQAVTEYGGFEGLPRAWAHAGQSPVILHDNAKFDRVLGQLLVWLTDADALQAYYRTPLVKAIVGNFDNPVVAVLRAWLQQHPDRACLEAVSMALSEAQRSIVWTEKDLIIELLRSAEGFGEECQQTVSSYLSKAAISSSGVGGILGGQATDEGQLATNARRILVELPISSPARHFYRQLAEFAEQMMQRLTSPPFAQTMKRPLVS